MKRGNYWPQARSRWVRGRNTGPGGNPPCWLRWNFTVYWLWPVEDPIGLPVWTTGDDCQFAQWGYDVDLGGNTWKATWSNVWGDGVVKFSQQLWAPLGNIMAFAFWWGPDVGPPDLLITNEDVGDDGTWTNASWNFGGLPTIQQWNYPVVAWSWIGVKPVIYQDLFNAGIDEHDTAPRSWISGA